MDTPHNSKDTMPVPRQLQGREQRVGGEGAHADICDLGTPDTREQDTLSPTYTRKCLPKDAPSPAAFQGPGRRGPREGWDRRRGRQRKLSPPPARAAGPLGMRWRPVVPPGSEPVSASCAPREARLPARLSRGPWSPAWSPVSPECVASGLLLASLSSGSARPAGVSRYLKHQLTR